MKLESIEGVRGFAAIYVFVHHLNPLAGTLLEPVLKLGQEAVILFFLVSGFVIAYSQLGSTAAKSPTIFLLKRAIRIYPIFLVSLFLSALLALASGDARCINARDFVGNLLMLQDIGLLKSGTWVEPFCSNAPLWSLSYEWWFYVAFALLSISNHWSLAVRRSIVASLAFTGTILFQLEPVQPFLFASYFSLWWAGVELCIEYMQRKKISFEGQNFSILLLFACAAIWMLPVLKFYFAQLPVVLGREPFLQLRHFFAGIAFVIAAIVASQKAFVPNAVIRAFAAVAPISYGLYVSHQPVIELVRKLRLGEFTLVVTILLALGLAYLLEIVLQPRIAGWLRGSKPFAKFSQ